MKGQKYGKSSLSIKDMEKIVKLTEEGVNRPDIAKEIGVSKMTVYNWQKKLLG